MYFYICLPPLFCLKFLQCNSGVHFIHGYSASSCNKLMIVNVIDGLTMIAATFPLNNSVPMTGHWCKEEVWRIGLSIIGIYCVCVTWLRMVKCYNTAKVIVSCQILITNCCATDSDTWIQNWIIRCRLTLIPFLTLLHSTADSYLLNGKQFKC